MVFKDEVYEDHYMEHKYRNRRSKGLDELIDCLDVERQVDDMAADLPFLTRKYYVRMHIKNAYQYDVFEWLELDNQSKAKLCAYDSALEYNKKNAFNRLYGLVKLL